MFVTPEAEAFLEKSIGPDATVLEYGGGVSTHWLLDRVGRVFTFEANHEICVGLLQSISQDHKLLAKWRLYFVGCDWDDDQRGKRRYVKHRGALIPEAAKMAMEQDLTADILDDVDAIIINGAIRYKSLVRAVKVFERIGQGILVVNNTEVPWREEFISRVVPSHWRRIDLASDDPPQSCQNIDQSGMWITSIWVARG
jgi:hypothetical protein